MSVVTILLPGGLDWMNLEDSLSRKWFIKESTTEITRKFIAVLLLARSKYN